ncbi:MAG TPA: hypothetical protein VMU39_16800 [Solirubrobacteraceae bacterium]|nr:hypothetical protein [Solirubrobacteraceae bacterium]
MAELDTSARAPSRPPQGCALDERGFGSQLRRYRRLSEHVTTLQRTTGQVIAHFGPDLPPGLLERTLEVERRCCPFVDTSYKHATRRLTLAVESVDQDPRLDSLFHALTPAHRG